MSVRENHVSLTVRSDLAGGVLPAVVAMLAARADCPLDRLDEALLLADAVAAHAPRHAADGHLRIDVAVDADTLELAVGGLPAGGAQGLIEDATLPDVGAVLERIADELHTEQRADEGERLVMRMHYAAAAGGAR